MLFLSFSILGTLSVVLSKLVIPPKKSGPASRKAISDRYTISVSSQALKRQLDTSAEDEQKRLVQENRQRLAKWSKSPQTWLPRELR
ncbi:hypothetical protein V8C44DRAFT_123554 [Trichoderma aethiopicum]